MRRSVDPVQVRQPTKAARISSARPVAGALAIGLAAAVVGWALLPLNHGADFQQFHYAARAWLSGHNAYAGGFPIMRATRVVPEPFFYPFPTLLAVAPLAALPLTIAVVTFIGLSTVLLAYGLLRSAPHQLPLFLGAGFLAAVALDQWSPIITATLLLPALAWLAVLKPNIGLAVTVANPTRIGVLGGAALLLATLALQPTWPMEWLRNLHAMPPHPAPILVPGGVLALLALLRWRRPEARLIVAMACVPQLLYFADQLPLWLVPQTRRESMFLSAGSMVAWAAAVIINTRAGRIPAFSSAPFVLAGVYFPALIMVLRRPNMGELPPRLERASAKLPTWIRGVAP